MEQVTVVLGAQWGDEGKGKWVDHLASSAHIIARFQGGSNAGHTLFINGKKVVLHQLPSGICHAEKLSCLLAGVVVDPVALLREWAELGEHARISPSNFMISSRAHVISPYHIYRDELLEAQRQQPIGTTKRGIGPTYSSKYNRTGLRMGDYIEEDGFHAWLSMMEATNSDFAYHRERESQSWQQFMEAAAVLRPFVGPVESIVRRRLDKGDKLLLEGAQGSLLDIDHGTYPYVTSSSTIASSAAVSLGIDPRKISRIYGIAKAYTTRVGAGAFPSEIHDEIADLMVERGAEFGATTKRRRRVGWFDAVAINYARELNGLDGIFLNKIDILSGIETLKIVTAYRDEAGRIYEEFPSDHRVLARCEAIVAEYPGWSEDIRGMRKKSELPSQARNFVEAIAKAGRVPILMVGTGPNRDDYIAWDER